MGSALELKNRLSRKAYRRVKPHFSGKHWEVVVFDLSHLVLRVEDENLKFNRVTGKLTERVGLSPRKKLSRD